jgi:hypothetical protein
MSAHILTLPEENYLSNGERPVKQKLTIVFENGTAHGNFQEIKKFGIKECVLKLK